jgi:lysophospholipase L1-like esterase
VVWRTSLASICLCAAPAGASPSPPQLGLVVDCDATLGREDAAEGGGGNVTIDGAIVPRWESQVGSGFFSWSTAEQSPVWDAQQQAIVFNEGADQRFAMSLSGSQDSFSFAVIAEIPQLQRSAAGAGHWQGYGPPQYQPLVGTPSLSLLYAGNSTYPEQNPSRFTVDYGSLAATDIRLTSTLALFGVAGGVGNVKVFQNNEIATFSGNGSQSFTDFYLGGPGQYTGATSLAVRRVLAWDHQLNETELADLYAFAQDRYGVIDLDAAPQRILLMGDSIGAGNSASTQRGFFRLATQPFTHSAIYNFAESDSTLADMHAEFGAIIAPVLTLGNSKNVVLIEGGTNDLHSTTPAAAYARLQALAADVRAVDPQATIIVSTVTPRITPGDQADIDAYNSLLRAEFNRQLPWTTAAAHGPNIAGTIDADFLWDVTADPVMGPAAAASDFNLYRDGLHPTTAGHQQMAASLSPLLTALCGNLIEVTAEAGLDLYVQFDDGQAFDLTEGRGADLGRYTLPISVVDLPDGLHMGQICAGDAATPAPDDEVVADVAPFQLRLGLLMTDAEAALMDGTVAINSDFDGDGDVDGGDFLTWQRGLSLTGQTSKANGDANGDGHVDAADLANWQAHFGLSPSIGGGQFLSQCRGDWRRWPWRSLPTGGAADSNRCRGESVV